MQEFSKQIYIKFGNNFENYLRNLVADAVYENQEVQKLHKAPVIGKYISDTLEKAVADIVYNVINNMVNDLLSDKNDELMTEIADLAINDILNDLNEKMSVITEDVISDSIEIMKDQVKIQQWKIKYNKEKQINK